MLSYSKSIVPCVFKFRFWSLACQEQKCKLSQANTDAMMDKDKLISTKVEQEGKIDCEC
jgi:hypothetical protein